MTDVELSVVIGFKDWGLDRLLGAVRSLNEALEFVSSEIIVSDYGSQNSLGYDEAIEFEGANYIRTETDGVWSRSRALNAGLQVSRGRIVVTTDADMVFSPETFKAVLESFAKDFQQYIVMQCNDLPEGIDHRMIEAGEYSWDELRRISKQRPRWGMGGMIAVPRSAYIESRGLDERMEIYGGEDIDFARRMRRLGYKLHWLEDDRAQMYHVWHPSSRGAAIESSEGRKAIAVNRDIQLNDKTAARNIASWNYPPEDNIPVVSVVISTHNRSEFIEYSVRSVLAQTMPYFELLVIDDGSVDDTAQVVNAIDDDRIVYYYQENRGLAAARNFATTVARGKYIAVMDDDDVMLPDRLESSLSAMADGVNGVYGGWVDFAEVDGSRKFRTGKSLSMESILFNNSIFLHPTLLVERRLMQAVPYDEELRSGSDYNMAIRMLRAGARFTHCGKYVMLRRNHEGQITAVDTGIQKASGAISAFFGRAGMLSKDVAEARIDRAEKDKVSVASQKSTEPGVLEYLPDHAVTRAALVRLKPGSELSSKLLGLLNRIGRPARLSASGARTSVIYAEYRIDNLLLLDLLQLRASPALEVFVETVILSENARMTIAEPLRFPDERGLDAIIKSRIVDHAMQSDREDEGFSAIIISGPSYDVVKGAVRAIGSNAVSIEFQYDTDAIRSSYVLCMVDRAELDSLAYALSDRIDDERVSIVTVRKDGAVA